MTIAVNIDGPNVVTVLSKKIHQRIVANLQVKKWAARPHTPMDKQHNFSGAGESFVLTFQVFFPQIDS